MEKNLASLLQGASEAVFVVDESCRIHGCNEMVEQLLGFRDADFVGASCADRLQGRGAANLPVCCERCGVIHRALTFGRVSSFEMEIHTRENGWCWVDVSILVWRDPSTRKPLLVHLMRDITRRRQLEHAAGELLKAVAHLSTLPDAPHNVPPGPPLTSQEKRILGLFAAGKESNAIAQELAISARTLRNHLHNINQKLHTHNRLEAVMFVTHRGLI